MFIRRLLCLVVGLSPGLLIGLASHGDSWRGDLIGRVGERTLDAEQIWPKQVPTDYPGLFGLGLSVAKTLGFFDRAGSVPKFFLPETRSVFAIPQFAVPLSQMLWLCDSDDESCLRPLVKQASNGPVFEMPLHPLEVRLAQRLQALGYPRLPDTLMGTPTASTRSLFTMLSPERPEVDILKLSLSAETSGWLRQVTRQDILRSVNGSRIVREAFERTGGKTPLSGAPWIFMPEAMGAIPAKLSADQGGGVIRRSYALPMGVDRIPAYGLNVKTGSDSQTWLDLLFRHSGYTSRLEFIWDKLLAPQWELHLMLALYDGEALTSHGQNNGYLVTAENQVAGIFIQDLSNPIDPAVRWYNGLSTPWIFPDWAQSKELGMAKARSNVLDSLNQFHRYFFLNVIGMRLNDADRHWLEVRMQIALRQFAQRYLGLSIESEDQLISEIQKKLRQIDQMDVVDLPGRRPSMGANQVLVERSSVSRTVAHREALASMAALGGETFATGESLILLADQHERIVAGTQQNLNAIGEFLRELQSGTRRWAEVLPPALVEELIRHFDLRSRLKRSGDSVLAVFSAADFMHDSVTGEFVPLEIQISPSPGSLLFQDVVHEAVSAQHGEGDALTKIPSVYVDYQNFVTRALGLDHPARIVILDYHPNAIQNALGIDEVASAAQLALEAQALTGVPGVDLVTTDVFDQLSRDFDSLTGICLTCGGNQVSTAQGGETRLVRKSGGLRFRHVSPKGEVLDDAHVDLVLSRIQYDHLPNFLEQLATAERRGEVSMATHPLALVASAKTFQAYLPALVRLYSGQPPVLTAPDTKVFFNAEGSLDEVAFEKIFASAADYVFKPAYGFGGKKIVFGEDMTAMVEKDLRRHIQSEPMNWVAQRVLKPSLAQEYISGTDRVAHFRFFASYLNGQTWIHELGFATLAPLQNGSGTLTNISKNGAK